MADSDPRRVKQFSDRWGEDVLADYYDLVMTGWAASADGLDREGRERWVEEIKAMSAADRLPVGTEVDLNAIGQVAQTMGYECLVGFAELLRPDTTSYPEALARYRQYGELRVLIDRDWSTALLRVRSRVKIDLDRSYPGWQDRYVRHG